MSVCFINLVLTLQVLAVNCGEGEEEQICISPKRTDFQTHYTLVTFLIIEVNGLTTGSLSEAGRTLAPSSGDAIPSAGERMAAGKAVLVGTFPHRG